MGVHKKYGNPGEKYGRLTIIGEAELHISPCGKKRRKVLVQCSCGNSEPFEVLLDNLRKGNTTSCGCVQKEKSKETIRKINNKKSNLFLIHVPSNTVIGYTTKMEKFYFDREDLEKVKQYCWHINKKGYLQGYNTNTGKMIQFHRLVTNCPKDKVVDHINHDPLDNRKSNLRICSQSENMKNLSIRSNNKSGITGVSWNKARNKWYATIGVDGKLINLGYFTDKEEAIKTRRKAEIKYYGEFACTES